ncbi:MAG: hypothetical protein ACPLRY_07605 [Candidatus Bathyarchaeales archaeon]
MKIGKNSILALSLAFLLTLPALAVLTPTANAEENAENAQSLPVKTEPLWNNVWYKFETSLITLIFPANGTKPMFLWWYTNDNSTIYVMKFKGVIEYLTFDCQYYDRRYQAEEAVMQQVIGERCIEPRIGHYANRERIREAIISRLMGYLIGLHSAYLPFSACKWSLEGPELVEKGDISYWSFNFTLKKVPMWKPRFEFAEDNIQIRCRFYNMTTTENIDENHNYTVAAGQLKFDFVVSNWQWNIDKIKAFVDWLNSSPYAQYQIEIPTNKTGLALWVNMASIKLQDLNAAQNEVQNQYQETLETASQMQAATINDEYYQVSENKTQNEYERQVQVTSRFRNRTRIQYAKMNTEGNISGFLEFVPWARLLNETGETVDYVNVTASYIAAGAHLRLFICYPYFGNYTLEHDPTIGLTSTQTIPELITPKLLIVLIGATVAIAVAVAAVKILKKPVNMLAVK